MYMMYPYTCGTAKEYRGAREVGPWYLSHEHIHRHSIVHKSVYNEHGVLLVSVCDLLSFHSCPSSVLRFFLKVGRDGGVEGVCVACGVWSDGGREGGTHAWTVCRQCTYGLTWLVAHTTTPGLLCFIRWGTYTLQSVALVLRNQTDDQGCDSFYRPESLLLFTPMSKASLEDSFYVVDRPALESVQQAKAWHEGEGAKHPKYFKRVLISAGATIKMMQHAMRGVERGMASDNGMPVEVMGLLLGRPSTDPEDPHYMVVTDAFPLPVDGVETRVEAGDEAMNFMIGLSESVEQTRDECLMGWYHSHPFDVGPDPNWFFSAVDCQNQLSWQRSEDSQGNPWLGIVVDPLRSIAKGKPEIGAFRSFMPTYTQSPERSPDGALVDNKDAVVRRWGNCWNRYYSLGVDYFMSDMTRTVVDVLSKNFLWMSILSTSSKNEREYRDRFSDRVNAIATNLDAADSGGRFGVGSAGIPSSLAGGTDWSSHSSTTGGSPGSRGTGDSQGRSSSLQDACARAKDIAIETSLHEKTQVSKQTLFGMLDYMKSHKCSEECRH